MSHVNRSPSASINGASPSALGKSGVPAALNPTIPPQRLNPMLSSAALPTDLVGFRKASPGGIPSGLTSVTDEPSAANNGNVIFMTGNWYAAVSTDSGATFSYLDPFSDFPASYGGFCCDQSAIYEPTRDITAWSLMYLPDATGSNAIRLAVANGKAGVAGNSWHYWDFTAQQLGFAAGQWLDYPQLATSSNYLYLSANVFAGNISSGPTTFTGSTIVRLSLSPLAQGGVLGFDSYTALCGVLDCPWGFAPVVGAGTTMYWAAANGTATTISTTSLRVFAWPDSVLAVMSFNISHSGYIHEVHGSCASPDGYNMCGHDDSRLRSGSLAQGILGFMWDAGSGSAPMGNFPYPYVQGVRINASTMTLVDEPVIWYTGTAYAYPNVAVNARGHLGLTVAFGGGAYYPSAAVGVEDDLSPTNWQLLAAAFGTNGPSDNVWGDYLAARPASGNGASWIATGYTLQGGNTGTFIVPLFLWFGRQRDDPFAPQVVQGLAIVSPTLSVNGKLASFTGPSGFLGDYSVVVDWGDGALSSGSAVRGSSATAFDVAGSHTYLHPGAFVINITVQDGKGSSASGSSTVTVSAPSSTGGWWSEPAGPRTARAPDGPWYTKGLAPQPSPAVTHSVPRSSSTLSGSPGGSPVPGMMQADVSLGMAGLAGWVARLLRALLG